jgi:hypothetical protein
MWCFVAAKLGCTILKAWKKIECVLEQDLRRMFVLQGEGATWG